MDTDTLPTGAFRVQTSPERHALAVANRRAVEAARRDADADEIVRLDGMAQQLAVERQVLEQEVVRLEQVATDLRAEVTVIRAMNADLQARLDVHEPPAAEGLVTEVVEADAPGLHRE